MGLEMWSEAHHEGPNKESGFYSKCNGKYQRIESRGVSWSASVSQRSLWWLFGEQTIGRKCGGGKAS